VAELSGSASGDWPPSRRSGALARREGGKVARTRRLESPRYFFACGLSNNVSAAPSEWSNIDVGPVTEADWRNDLLKPSDVSF
jgi:hypothetical protein